MSQVLTLILGGGAGTRLYPLTKYRAKPAVPLAGKYRLIDVAVSNCINSGLKKMYVLTQYLSSSLNRHVSQSFSFDPFSDGFVDILAAEQTASGSSWFEGTADAVRKHWSGLDNYDCDQILILPGDALYRMDYRPMIKEHLETDADITIAVNAVAQRNAHHFGLLRLDEQGAVADFREKPKTREEQVGFEAPAAALERFGLEPGNEDIFLASMGVYLFKREVLHRYMTESTQIDFGKEILPAAITRDKVQGYIFSGYWEDIGTIEAFYKAHMDFLKDNPPFRFAHPGFPVFTRPRFLPNSRFSGALVDRGAIADGCQIGRATIRSSVIGLRSRIDDHTTIEDSIIMGADHYDPAPMPPWQKRTEHIPLGIGKYCHIKRAIIDKNVRIGRDVKILNERNVMEEDGDFYHIRDGIVIIQKNAVIPNGAII